MRARTTLIIPLAALAAALVACGDSGPSKATFTTKADASCAVGNAAISAATKPTNAPQVATAAGATVSAVDGQVAMLRAMKMPGGKDKAQIEAIIAAIGEVSAPTKSLQDAAAKTDDAGMGRAAVDMQAKADAAATAAQAYGLTQCGTGLKPAVAGLFDGTKSVVKATYVTKAEAACRDMNRKAAALTQPGTSLSSLSRFVDAYLPIVTKFVADFKAIPVPPGDEATIGEIVKAIEAGLPKMKEVGAAAKANNAKLVGALFEELDVNDTAINAKLDAYGLKVCGTNGGF